VIQVINWPKQGDSYQISEFEALKSQWSEPWNLDW